nr:cupin domain-containing protein [Parabacteroides goldsteinii]
MNQESANFQFEEKIEWQDLGGGVRRQIMGYNDNIMMVKVMFETGAIGAPHVHPHSQVTYVASGVFKFMTDGETQIVRAGDGVYMKPDVMHGCECLEAGILIDTFNPLREDFL